MIFKHKKINYVFLHIPKCNGKYIRNLIRNQFEVIKEYWGIDESNNSDLAHISYNIANEFLDKNTKYKFISFIRNPYDRIISAFFYLNESSNKKDFNDFIIKDLNLINFDNYKNIHFLHQYKFLNFENIEIINFDNVKNNQKVTSCNLKLENFELKKYNIKKYFNTSSLKIFNKFYEKDIKLCNLDKINYIKHMI